ncbi:MAG TPA: hypothetical protein VGC54_01730 [Planctomycetota bacterium]
MSVRSDRRCKAAALVLLGLIAPACAGRSVSGDEPPPTAAQAPPMPAGPASPAEEVTAGAAAGAATEEPERAPVEPPAMAAQSVAVETAVPGERATLLEAHGGAAAWARVVELRAHWEEQGASQGDLLYAWPPRFELDGRDAGRPFHQQIGDAEAWLEIAGTRTLLAPAAAAEQRAIAFASAPVLLLALAHAAAELGPGALRGTLTLDWPPGPPFEIGRDAEGRIAAVSFETAGRRFRYRYGEYRFVAGLWLPGEVIDVVLAGRPRLRLRNWTVAAGQPDKQP